MRILNIAEKRQCLMVECYFGEIIFSYGNKNRLFVVHYSGHGLHLTRIQNHLWLRTEAPNEQLI